MGIGLLAQGVGCDSSASCYWLWAHSWVLAALPWLQAAELVVADSYSLPNGRRYALLKMKPKAPPLAAD